MVTLQPITPANASTFKAVRLRALLDTPAAFGSTYAKEAKLTDSEWQHRAVQWNSIRSIGYIAIADQVPCGIAAGFLDDTDARKAHLVSMWIAPSHRGLGLGKRMVAAVVEWARCKGVDTMCLMVTSTNETAIGFYQRLGFVKTGRVEPYPNDPALVEYEMHRQCTSFSNAGRT